MMSKSGQIYQYERPFAMGKNRFFLNVGSQKKNRVGKIMNRGKKNMYFHFQPLECVKIQQKKSDS